MREAAAKFFWVISGIFSAMLGIEIVLFVVSIFDEAAIPSSDFTTFVLDWLIFFAVALVTGVIANLLDPAPIQVPTPQPSGDPTDYRGR